MDMSEWRRRGEVLSDKVKKEGANLENTNLEGTTVTAALAKGGDGIEC